MEGLGLRFVPQKDQIVEPNLIWKNLTESYAGHYRNLDNSRVHYDDNIQKLVQNYRSAYLQLAYYYSTQAGGISGTAPIPYESLDDQVAHFGELTSGQKVEVILDKMESVLPEDVLPISNVELEIQVGLMYYNIGRNEELQNRLQHISEREPLTQMDILRLASVYLQYLRDEPAAETLFQRVLKEYPGGDTEVKIATVYMQYGSNDRAEQHFEKALDLSADNGQAVGGLLRVYDQTQQYDKAIQLLEKWSVNHPQDPSVKREIEKYQAKLTSRDTLINR
jgi:tetratricopeptide (TPR) repeat protein